MEFTATKTLMKLFLQLRMSPSCNLLISSSNGVVWTFSEAKSYILFCNAFECYNKNRGKKSIHVICRNTVKNITPLPPPYYFDF